MTPSQRPRRQPRPPVCRHTSPPQEHSIAELVVQGLTNRETARHLFIAEKTVQYHLTRIYSKFAIRSRTELARVYGAGASHAETTEWAIHPLGMEDF
ncbi:helix-turn-helix transcriptional regulator [Yaniella sp.]|uniref:helix-turn-helix domain-containing protein n=1 Tax=Yaniella sp. TaxID=2773929 RepID=UPI0026486CE5|nr:helix-turn-helix transcriptional regulator [Yaniella sp.]